MANTRFMERMFSATENQEEELLNQVAGDIQKAKEDGLVETDELKFEKFGEDQVLITDKANQQITVAEMGEEGNVDLYNPEDQIAVEEGKMDGFLHPEVKDEVIPGEQPNPTENVEEHLEEGVISPNLPNGGNNPEAGVEKTVEETAEEGACPECGQEPCICEEESQEEEKEFSVYSDNTVIQKIFSQQEYCETLFSEIIATEDVEDVAKVGNLKIEKVDEDTVIVSDLASGDQAKVKLDEENLEVEELGHKEFSEEGETGAEEEHEEQFDPIHVVGVDAGNHQLVDSSVFDEESADDLATRLSEAGVDAVQIFDNESDARDYAIELLDNLGVESEEDVEEPEEATFSDVDGYEYNVFVTRYYSNSTAFMTKLFSETNSGIEVSQAKIEDALENGDEIETETEIVTPISATEAVVEDKENGEFTKVTVDDDNMKLDNITEDEANDLMEDIAVSEDEVDEDEEAENLVENAEDDAEQAEEDEVEAEEDEDEEKDFSDIMCNEAETKFFSENEPMTQYMIRLFSEEEKEELIEKAIEEGDQIENDTVVITPVDAETAVIEDKDNGEFTKAILSEEDINVTPISEEEADALTEDLAVSEEEEKVEEEDDKKEDEKKEEKGFSVLDKWFADVVAPAAGIQAQPVTQAAPAPVVVAPQVDENGNPVQVVEEEPAPSVEAIEDKAIAAVQQIQAAAAEAEAAILNAKAAPVEGEEADLQEATFSENDEEKSIEKTFSNNEVLVSWLKGTNRN